MGSCDGSGDNWWSRSGWLDPRWFRFGSKIRFFFLSTYFEKLKKLIYESK
jgi:hypothetical protein